MLLLLLFFLQESLKENSQSDVYSGRKLGQLKVLKHSHLILLKKICTFIKLHIYMYGVSQ